jgi:hypothetical protein
MPSSKTYIQACIASILLIKINTTMYVDLINNEEKKVNIYTDAAKQHTSV